MSRNYAARLICPHSLFPQFEPELVEQASLPSTEGLESVTEIARVATAGTKHWHAFVLR